MVRDDVSEPGSTALSAVSDGTFRFVVGEDKVASIVAVEEKRGHEVAARPEGTDLPNSTSTSTTTTTTTNNNNNSNSSSSNNNNSVVDRLLFQPQAGSGDAYLHVAAACCGVEDCRRLIESSTPTHPVDINATNNEGRTPLHLAALRNKVVSYKRRKTQDTRHKTKDNRQQTQDTRQKTHDTRQQTKDKRQKIKDKRLKIKDKRQKIKDKR
jgi:hypothetical protein